MNSRRDFLKKAGLAIPAVGLATLGKIGGIGAEQIEEEQIEKPRQPVCDCSGGHKADCFYCDCDSVDEPEIDITITMTGLADCCSDPIIDNGPPPEINVAYSDFSSLYEPVTFCRPIVIYEDVSDPIIGAYVYNTHDGKFATKPQYIDQLSIGRIIGDNSYDNNCKIELDL